MLNTQDQINQYFSNHWNGKTSKYYYTHQRLVEKVSQDEWILDVGCGRNPHKATFKNLWGIDPAFDEADQRVSIEDFVPTRLYDVAFCLGSINFGQRSDIEKQISKIVSCLKPTSRIYWRCNPGRHDHGNDQFQAIKVYPWTFEDLHAFAEQFGFRVTEHHIDSHNGVYEATPDSNHRLYAEWTRP